ncbi:DUF2252 domain-containing protein [Prescottella equi]|uniref:DUF2252 domain-containing protein n=1 Tax=Rhodococcus hoagii TaxID=43767 RepID=UPI000A10CA80|nr:DUF2252 domain-containing protein [Prescottella equi]ORK00220.1 hypothetical protein A6F58_02745 [Prescottella equi]
MSKVAEASIRADRADRGEAARRRVPFDALADLAGSGRDPIELLRSQDLQRIPELLPIRYGRMVSTPFAFYRGAAAVMADDLSRTPNSGLHTHLCGDAHLSNFGVFATPERRLAFDVNDFDETYPGPFEWDVKRLVASVEVAARVLSFGGKRRHRIALACAAAYRETMSAQARLGNLAVWYSHVEAEQELADLRETLDAASRRSSRKLVEKSWRRDSLQALGKLTTMTDDGRRIVSRPPLLVPIEEVFETQDARALYRELSGRLAEYRETLRADHRVPFGRYAFVQAARKVVGVGSVGTRSWILLLLGADDSDPLFLQAKEAQPSVLAQYLHGPDHPNQGQRVVEGQRIMQAASDIFLGWQQGVGNDGVRRDYYVRQLRDAKGSATVESMTPTGMEQYARLCGRVLGYAHARGGDRFAIAEYLGPGTGFDEAMAAFARAYADRTEQDRAMLAAAVEEGRIPVSTPT